MMLPAESGTLPHRPWTPMSLVNGRSPQAKRSGRDGAKRKYVRKRLPLQGSCSDTIEKQLPPVTAQSTIGKQLHSAKQGAIGTSNLPNQQHRDAHPAAMHHREAAAAREAAKHHREAAPQRKARHHREAATAREGAKHHREAAPQRKARHLRESNLPNQQHREEHFLSNNGAKRAGAEGVRGSNLACFLKNFVSNYIVIFLMMLFRVHL